MGKRILIVGVLIVVFGASLVLVDKLFSGSDTVLVKIGNTELTQKDLDDLLTKYAFARRGKAYSAEEKKAALDNLVKGTLISMEAEKERLDQSPDFKSKLRAYRNELLVQEYINTKVQPAITVTDQELDKIIKEHPNLIPKETLTLQEIVVSKEKEAKDIYEELKKGGNFAKIAGEKSISDTRVNGGTMRPVARGQLPKVLEDVAFNLKKGEFSKPIKTERGFCILLLAERKERTPEEMKDLESKVKEKLVQIESSKKAQEILDKKAAELREKVKVEVFYDRVQ
jgi:peptidyl-prolyl cis-trans isomerase C